MNRDDIIRMAREAGIRLASQSDTVDPRNVYFHEIERYAHLVVAHEREECAKVCDALSVDPEYASQTTKIAAMAIRDRGEK